MIRIVKVSDRLQFDEVYKCVPYVAVIFHVNRQIKKIVFALKLRIDFRNKKFFGEFIWNVLYHNCCLIFLLNFVPEDIELFFIVNRERILFIFFRLLLHFIVFVNFMNWEIVLAILHVFILHHLVILFLNHLLLLQISLVK